MRRGGVSKAALLALLPMSLWALDGTVTNRTTGKPQAGAKVTLVRLGEGMQPVGTTTTDGEGKFAIAHTMQGPYMVQVNHQDVNYTRMLPPGTKPEGVALEVADASTRPEQAEVVQHMIVLEPSAADVQVSEAVTINNTGSRTWNDPANGTYRFFVPPDVKGEIGAQVTGPGGMALPRPAQKTKEPNVYSIAFPVRPGETQFEVRYTLPKDAANQVRGRLTHTTGRSFIVTPAGVTLTGQGLVAAGTEPRTQAKVYGVSGPEWVAAVTGTGTLQPPPQQGGGGQAGESSGPEIAAVVPRIYTRLPWVLALSFGVLGAGFALLYRMQPAPDKGKRG